MEFSPGSFTSAASVRADARDRSKCPSPEPRDGATILDESFATTYENYLGHFLAAQYRAINSEPFDRLVARAARQDRLGRIGAARRERDA